MDQEEQKAGLYDFLYRDAGRIASYYAQLFSGHLVSYERTTSSKDAKDAVFKGGLWSFVAGERKKVTETQSGEKEVFNPHDLITIDLLASLEEQGRINHDVDGAPNGAIIQAKGSLAFIDHQLLGNIIKSVNPLMQMFSGSLPEDVTTIFSSQVQALGSFMEAFVFPSVFMLNQENGKVIGGTLKETGMEEPISAYHFKHGGGGLPDAYVIGIKELQQTNLVGLEGSLFDGARQVADGLQKMIFPANMIRVVPLAIFRELHPATPPGRS